MPDLPVILITGTSQGIGRQLAEHFAARGYQVVGCSRSDVQAPVGNYCHHSLDVADEAAIKRMFSEIRRQFGRLDALVNNAGIASMNHLLLTPMTSVHDVLRHECRGNISLLPRGRQTHATPPVRADR